MQEHSSGLPAATLRDRLLSGGGETGALLRRRDWSGTPLGPIETWPLSLCFNLSTVLQSPVPQALMWGRDGVLLYNDGYAALCGERHQGAFGRPVEEAWPEAADFNRRILDVCLGGGSLSLRDEWFSLAGTGRPETDIWLDLDYSPVLDETGEPAGVLAIVIDTTVRVRTAEQARAAEDLRAAVLDGIGDCFYALDGDLRFTFFNTACERFFGRTRDEMVGQSLFDAFPKARDSRLEEIFRRVAETGQAERHELGSVAREGRMIDLRVFPTAQGIGVGFTDITDQFRAERARQQSQEQFRTLADNIDQFAWMADSGGWIYWYNRRWYDYTGSTHAEMQGWGWNKVLHPDHARRVNDHLAFCFATGTPWEDTFPLRDRDGAYHWFLSRALPIRGRNDEIIRWFGTSTDISEQIVAENALRESEERFRNMADSAPALIWASDAEGSITFANRRYELDFGMPSEAILADGWHRIIHEDDLPAFNAAFLNAVERRGVFRSDVRVWNKDRQLRWLRCEGTPRFDGEGRFLGFVGCNVDITEAKLAADALEAEVQVRTRERDRIWNVSQDLLVVTNRSGTWLRINPAWTAALGWRETDLVGKSSEWLEHPEERALTRVVLGEALRAGRTMRVENRMRHRDGQYRWFSWTGVEDDELFYFVARDITEDKNAAETLRRTEDALRQSQKMEAVGQLTGGIAHDFNNLLTGIIGSLDLLRRRLAAGRSADVDRFIDAAVTSANRAAGLTHRLLAFSRRQPLDPQPVDVTALIGSMGDLLRRTLGENIGLEIVLGDDVWIAECDPNQLESSVLNLAINARDAMPAGGTLTIETNNTLLDEIYAFEHEWLQPGDYVVICVTDTGTGMPQSVIERAFEPFFTTKPIGQGTGLGLSMVYGFARQSRGHVRIDSEVGTGTTVKLYLPRSHGKARPRHDAGAFDAYAVNGETVLLVEDDPAVRLLVAEVMREQGFGVLEAADARAALPILSSKEQIDLLVSDVGLPGMNGRQLADVARQHRPGLRVLFITGYAENAATRSGFLDAGMDMITKPFATDVLVNKLHEMLAR